MSKLTPKEMFLIIILVNVVVYYIGYLVIFTPLNSLRASQHEKYTQSQAKHDELVDLQTKEKKYAEEKTTYTRARLEYYDRTFSKAERDQIATFLGYKVRDNHLSFEGCEFEKEAKNKKKDGDNDASESFFKSHIIKLTCTGTYKNIIDFVESVEKLGKSSSVQKLEITPYAEDKINDAAATQAVASASTEDNNNVFCKAVITFNFITVDKDEKDDSDNEFAVAESDKAVSQNLGKNTLRMEKSVK